MQTNIEFIRHFLVMKNSILFLNIYYPGQLILIYCCSLYVSFFNCAYICVLWQVLVLFVSNQIWFWEGIGSNGVCRRWFHRESVKMPESECQRIHANYTDKRLLSRTYRVKASDQTNHLLLHQLTLLSDNILLIRSILLYIVVRKWLLKINM